MKRQEKLKRRLERKVKSKKFQKSEWKKLHKKCWELQKQYLRKKWANFQDLIECFTCYKMIPIKEIHCGHFWHGALDFDLRNIKPQCAGCNMFRNGDLANYSSRLIREHGEEWFKELDKDAHSHPGYTIEELKEICSKYQNLLMKII